MTPSRPGGAAPETPVIGFDPEAVLERDSRILLDPAFLATLHGELAQELAPHESAATLLQMGFLHGLQDVTRALAATAGVRGEGPAPPLETALRMPCRAIASDGPPGSIVIEGSWPDCHEASAHLAALGRDAEILCFLSAGYTSGWLSGAFDADLLAIETHCSGGGSSTCRFVAREAAEWQARNDDAVARALAALPFGAFRRTVRERFARSAELPVPGELVGDGRVDRQAAAVHIWGPVMVLPYGGPDETLQALDLLARDPGAAEVSVIVVDLAGAIVDEAFGSLALEQLVQTAEAWGAETLFVDPSPLSARALADLDHPPLMVVKDLEPAIALAFQISRSQQRLA